MALGQIASDVMRCYHYSDGDSNPLFETALETGHSVCISYSYREVPSLAKTPLGYLKRNDPVGWACARWVEERSRGVCTLIWGNWTPMMSGNQEIFVKLYFALESDFVAFCQEFGAERRYCDGFGLPHLEHFGSNYG